MDKTRAATLFIIRIVPSTCPVEDSGSTHHLVRLHRADFLSSTSTISSSTYHFFCRPTAVHPWITLVGRFRAHLAGQPSFDSVFTPHPL